MEAKSKKPKVKLTGKNGNVFNLGAICSIALEDAGLKDDAAAMRKEIFAAKSYDEALQIMGKYCDVR